MWHEAAPDIRVRRGFWENVVGLGGLSGRLSSVAKTMSRIAAGFSTRASDRRRTVSSEASVIMGPGASRFERRQRAI